MELVRWCFEPSQPVGVYIRAGTDADGGGFECIVVCTARDSFQLVMEKQESVRKLISPTPPHCVPENPELSGVHFSKPGVEQNAVLPRCFACCQEFCFSDFNRLCAFDLIFSSPLQARSDV